MLDDDRAGSGRRPPCPARGLRRRSGRLAAAGTTALLLGPLALAAQASAATITPNRACYVNADSAKGAPMRITGRGFAARATVKISGATVSATTIASATGRITVRTSAPTIVATNGPASRATTLTATEDNAGGHIIRRAVTTVRSANLAVSTSPGSVKDLHKDRVEFSFSGFTPGKPIYGFYARKRIAAKTSFGIPRGACGLLRTRALLYPGGEPRFHQYTLTFESRSRYSSKANPRVTGKLTVYKP